MNTNIKTNAKTIGEIISTRRRSMGLSQVELAKQMTLAGSKTTQKSISKWETGMNEPSVTDFLLVCKLLDVEDIYMEYFGVNPHNPMTSLSEAGIAKVKDYVELLLATGLYNKKLADVTPIRRQLKVYDTPVSAGVGNFLEDSEFVTVEVDDRVSDEIFNAADFGIKISGNSMEPQYIDGQYAYIRSQDQLNSGEIGIFYLDGNVYIKKLQQSGKQCLLVSLNSDYKPIKVSSSSTFRILGKVLN